VYCPYTPKKSSADNYELTLSPESRAELATVQPLIKVSDTVRVHDSVETKTLALLIVSMAAINAKKRNFLMKFYASFHYILQIGQRASFAFRPFN
jgi:hypothetical protein